MLKARESCTAFVNITIIKAAVGGTLDFILPCEVMSGGGWRSRHRWILEMNLLLEIKDTVQQQKT